MACSPLETSHLVIRSIITETVFRSPSSTNYMYLLRCPKSFQLSVTDDHSHGSLLLCCRLAHLQVLQLDCTFCSHKAMQPSSAVQSSFASVVPHHSLILRALSETLFAIVIFVLFEYTPFHHFCLLEAKRNKGVGTWGLVLALSKQFLDIKSRNRAVHSV